VGFAACPYFLPALVYILGDNMDRIDAFIQAAERQTEAVRQNTVELQSIRYAIEKNLECLESQDKKLDKIEHHFSNGFKTSIITNMTQVEKGLGEKLGKLINGLKVQWVTMTLGFIPAMYYFVKQVF
jgi:hypothetical protein